MIMRDFGGSETGGKPRYRRSERGKDANSPQLGDESQGPNRQIKKGPIPAELASAEGMYVVFDDEKGKKNRIYPVHKSADGLYVIVGGEKGKKFPVHKSADGLYVIFGGEPSKKYPIRQSGKAAPLIKGAKKGQKEDPFSPINQLAKTHDAIFGRVRSRIEGLAKRKTVNNRPLEPEANEHVPEWNEVPDEIPVNVYLDTDDPSIIEQVVRHVAELVEALGYEA
jgi:hypothetical protein